jgi:hypothetical protein
MKANPGGELKPEHVVGRDGIIQNLWRVLDRQSVILTAERRMGKTSTIKKMNAEIPLGWAAVYQELEGIRTRAEFVERLFRKVKTFLGRSNRAEQAFQAVLKKLGGSTIGGVVTLPKAKETPWKMLLEVTLEDLNTLENRRFLLFWDELPLMLANIRRSEGDVAVMELLDTLRGLRQSLSNIRMVFTGSIGLHHILGDMRRSGYSNDPTNDMYDFDLPPLAPEDATELARALFKGEGIPYAVKLPAAVASSVDHFPYYIHHIADHFKLHGVAQADDLSGLIDEKLLDEKDPWDMAHYRQRINFYYLDLNPELGPVLDILDVFAMTEDPLTVSDLLGHVLISHHQLDRDQMLEVLRLLGQDNYIKRTPQGYFFKHGLIKRWWFLQRGLE